MTATHIVTLTGTFTGTLAVEGEASGGATDPDAENFFTRAGITDSTQKSAVDGLVTSLKGTGIWTKMRALYPFVGGTAASHSHNLKSSSYQITWVGGINHDADGITGATGYGETSLNLNTTTPGSGAMGVYRKNSVAATGGDLQVYASGFDYHVYPRFGDDACYLNWGAEYQDVIGSSSDAKGFWIISRTDASLETGYKNGVSFGANATSQGSLPSLTIRILAGYVEHSAGNLALAFISDGLSGAECVSLNTAVITFQTTLGRVNT